MVQVRRRTEPGDAPGWSWVEPAVWTPRMVTALLEGVKGGVWFTLIKRWPNAFFTAAGLVSLVDAHAAARHSSWR